MKNIKRKIFQIILTVFMVFSSCFLTGTVEAVDDTGNAARSSGYFTNENIYVSNNEIVGKESFKGERPEFVASNISTGSDLSENATEGMVWTNKKIEIIDKNTGIYKITFQALGFKYRYVDDQNNKVNDVWKNPLAAGSTLTISEKIADDFYVIENNEAYPIELAEGYVGYFNDTKDVNISYDPNAKTVTLSFNANGVKLDEYDEYNKFYYDENNNDDNGIAFNVEGSFYVQINNGVEDVGKIYSTGEADSSFEPAEDNFYYYEWGTTEDTLTYGYSGINWSNNDMDMTGIKSFQDIKIPILNPSDSNDVITFSIGVNSQGTNHLDAKSVIQKQGPDYIDDTPKKEYDNLYYIDVINEFDRAGMNNIYNWNELGIEKIYFYWYSETGTGENREAYVRVEVLYTNNIWGVYMAHDTLKLSNNGGNVGTGVFDSILITNKEDSVIRKDKDPNGDGIIDEVFDNHGKITLALPSINDVETKKTASLINWDERTYRIDLYAASNLEQQAEPVDIMFALDFSGSMPWLIEKPDEKIEYDDLKYIENKDNYRIAHNVTMGTISKWQSFEYFIEDTNEESDSYGEYIPIGYFDFGEDEEKKDGWYALKSGGTGDNVQKGSIRYDEDLKVNKDTIIYKKGNTQTKLDKLLEQVQSFINSLANSSPQSMIGFSCFAGTDLGTSEQLSPVNKLKDTGLMEFLNTKNVFLAGNTAQGVGIEKSQQVLEKGTNDNQFIILFTDGAQKNTEGQTDALVASKDAKREGIEIYTIGLANENNINDIENDLISWSNGDGYYFPETNFNGLEEAFNSIFDDLVGSIKNVEIIDVIDDRFKITEKSKQELSNQGIKVVGNQVTWEIDELRYCEDVLDGLHLSIEIVAKDDFLGGNYIPTNVASESIVKVGNITDQLDKPVVNVKPQLELNNGGKTYFLGEEIDPIEYIDTLLDQSNISLTDSQKESLITGDKISIDYSYKNTADKLGTLTFKYEPITTDEKVSSLETHNASKVGDGIEEYKLTVTYDVSTITERQNIIGNSYGYTDTSFKDNHTNCSHTTNSELIGKPHVAENVTVSGSYIVDVVDGSITINKTINDKVADPGTQGDTIVTFLIEGETVSGQNVHRYEVVRFNSKGTKSFTIDGLEKGVYTITELNSIRYDLADDGISIDKNDTNVPIVMDIENKKVTFYIGYTSPDTEKTNLKAKNVEATFTNELVNDENIGDTDVVTNKFSVNENGSVTITKDYYTVSQD